MQLDPKHFRAEHVTHYADRSVVEAYVYRTPYPAEVFDILAELITDRPRTVLDAGCGTGEIARGLIDKVERIDAVDIAEAMVAQGKRLPRGNDPSINWIQGRVEEVALHPPYALITAGSSLQWMTESVVLERFRNILSPKGFVATILPREAAQPWDDALQGILERYTVNQDSGTLSFYLASVTVGDKSLDPIRWLEARGLFEKMGEKHTAPVPFVRPLDMYIKSFHSRLGFSPERMGADRVAAFDEEVRALVSPLCEGGKVVSCVIGEVIWGRPVKVHRH